MCFSMVALSVQKLMYDSTVVICHSMSVSMSGQRAPTSCPQNSRAALVRFPQSRCGTGTEPGQS